MGLQHDDCFCSSKLDEIKQHGEKNDGCYLKNQAGSKIGGDWANAVYQISDFKFNYVGCYKDAGDRAMQGGDHVQNQRNIGECAQRCTNQNHKFFGMEFKECYCADTAEGQYAKHGKKLPSDCNQPGDDGSTGGGWALSVYEVPRNAECQCNNGAGKLECYKLKSKSDRAHKCASCNEGYHVDGNECERSGITQAKVKKMLDDHAIIMTEEELGAFFNKIDSDKDGIVTEEELTPELVPLINDPEEEANEASDNSQSDSLQEFISSTSQEAEASGSVTNLRSNSR
jgi:hypothetical protein